MECWVCPQLKDLKSPIGALCSEIIDRAERAMNIEQGLTSDDLRSDALSAQGTGRSKICNRGSLF